MLRAYRDGDYEVVRERLWLASAKGIRLLAYAALSVLSVVAVQYAIEWAAQPPVRAWIACDGGALISDGLRDALRADFRPAGLRYGCTTRHVSRAMPCLCCVGDHCWRSARVLQNATNMATMWDTVADGRVLKRRVPAWAVVTYERHDRAETYVRQERGEDVGDLFRALEYLHNLPFYGEESEL